MLPWRDPPRGPLLDLTTNIRVSSRPPRKAPLRRPKSAPRTNSRFISSSYQPERRGPIRRKRQITTHDDDSDEDDGGDVDGGDSSGWGTARTLAGLRGPLVDFS